MTTTEKLLPCPFCGNDDPLDDGMPEANLGVCCVGESCHMNGIVFTRRDWNTRSDLTPVSAEDLQKVREHLTKSLRYVTEEHLSGIVDDVQSAINILDRIAKAVG